MDPVTLALAKSWAEGQFGDLRQLQQHIAALQTVSGLAPYVQALLDSRIVEMGSNANGEYVRWENGLQVCWVLSLTASFVSQWVLGTTWTFPSSFVDSNVAGVVSAVSIDSSDSSNNARQGFF